MSGIVGRVKRLRQQRGMTLLAIFRKLGNLFLHHQRHLVWEAILTTPLSPSAWAEDEQFFVLGPENIDSEMTPQLLAFLGEYSSQVSEDIEGVRKGDRVFIVANETAYLHHVYIYLTNSRRGTRRDRKCFFPLETEDIPILGNAWTVPAAQGRGMFHRATNEQLRYLQKMGYARVVSYAEKNNPSSASRTSFFSTSPFLGDSGMIFLGAAASRSCAVGANGQYFPSPSLGPQLDFRTTVL